MFRFRYLTLLLILVLGMAVPVKAQDDGPQPQSSDAFWEAAYWNNQTLSGEPAVRRTESRLEHDWDIAAPAAEVGSDNFSARWTRFIEVPPPSGGAYRFVATSDDGIRVWVNEALIIDQWNDHSVQTYSAELNLSPGHHKIQVEYYENSGLAVAKVAFYNVENNFSNWRGAYYNNRWFSGDPVLVRDDAALNYNWGAGAPAAGLPADQFAVRWTRQIMVDAVNSGNWRFAATADDGIRVWVDGSLVISEWSEHPAQTFTADVALNAGLHELKVEYFENSGLAVARLEMTPLGSGVQGGWFGQYFPQRNLDNGGGTFTSTRSDATIDFNWGKGGPAGLPQDNFSVRWTRSVVFEPGTYRFRVSGDDGVRLWVNNRLLVDKWLDQAFATYTADIDLSGLVPMRLEYYEHSGDAAVRLEWMRAGSTTPPPPPPPGGSSLIVEEFESGFVLGGSADDWLTANEGHSGQLRWTRNSDTANAGYNWARWYPFLTAGRYELFVYIPNRYTTTSMARYWISHRDGFTQRIVNQSAYSDEWVSLGTYWFAGSDNEYLSLSDVTNEPNRSTLIAFDAAKWERR